jgi:hypothetical protein
VGVLIGIFRRANLLPDFADVQQLIAGAPQDLEHDIVRIDDRELVKINDGNARDGRVKQRSEECVLQSLGQRVAPTTLSAGIRSD